MCSYIFFPVSLFSNYFSASSAIIFPKLIKASTYAFVNYNIAFDPLLAILILFKVSSDTSFYSLSDIFSAINSPPFLIPSPNIPATVIKPYLIAYPPYFI